MGYWASVAKRAAVEAAKDAKVETRIGVVILFVTQAVIALGIFLVVGELSDANLWTRVMTALLPFALYPLVFLFRMTTVPAAIKGEDDSKAAALARAALDDPLANQLIITATIDNEYEDAPQNLIAVVRFGIGIDTPTQLDGAVVAAALEGGNDPAVMRCQPAIVRRGQGTAFRLPIGTTETLGKRGVVVVTVRTQYGAVGKPATRLVEKAMRLTYADRHAIVECASTIVMESEVPAPAT